MADICLGCFGLRALYSDYCMVCFFGKAILKSDTVVALRRSGSKMPHITLVSFSNVYYEYFCKLMWLSAKSPDVLELLNVMRQCKLRFFYINMNFIEQNIHVLCNMKSYECHLMKIIKGKWIFIMLFLTSVDYTTWRISVWVVLVSERRTQIIAWCPFSVKFFWNLTQWLLCT